MILFRILALFLTTLTVSHLAAQSEEDAVKAVINQFFEGMQKKDTSMILQTFTDAPLMQTYAQNREGRLVVRSQDFREFIQFIGKPSSNKYDERIVFKSIQIEQSLASVWTPYAFYLNDNFSHCGTNAFQLVKTDQGWKIQYIIDTRRKKCE